VVDFANVEKAFIEKISEGRAPSNGELEGREAKLFWSRCLGRHVERLHFANLRSLCSLCCLPRMESSDYVWYGGPCSSCD
jgi:hypothetical protein